MNRIRILSFIGLAAVAGLGVLMAVAGAPAEAAMLQARPDFLGDLHGDAGLAGLAFGGLVVNRATLSNAFVGFKTIFNKAFETAASDYQKVAMDVPSQAASEDYKWLGTTTKFRQWIGDRVIQNLSAHSYVIKNEPFENTIGVDRDDIEDNRLGIYSPMLQQLGYDGKTHPDELVFPLLKDGFARTCFDGQYFFDTDHPVIGADGSPASVSNMQAGAGPMWFLLDTSKPIRPFIFQKRRDYQFVSMDSMADEAVFSRKQFRYGVDARVNAGYGLWQMAFGSKAELTEANLQAAIAAMESFKGDNGKPLNIRPTLLVVPPSLKFTAHTLVKAEQIGGSTNVLRDAAEVLSSPWLA